MNVLIVGLGSIARKHIAALRSLEPEVQIYALRSTRFSNSVDGVTDLFSMKEVEEYSFDLQLFLIQRQNIRKQFNKWEY